MLHLRPVGLEVEVGAVVAVVAGAAVLLGRERIGGLLLGDDQGLGQLLLKRKVAALFGLDVGAAGAVGPPSGGLDWESSRFGLR